MSAKKVDHFDKSTTPAIDPNHRDLHGKPVSKMSRREMLASGAIPFMGYVALPSFVQLFANAGVAEAQDMLNCPSGGGALGTVITLNLAGGAGLHSNIVPLTKDGATLPTYDRMGLGTKAQVESIMAELMGVRWRNTSGIYLSMMDLANNFGNSTPLRVDVHNNTSAFWLAVNLMDDSSNNRISVVGLLQGAGNKGRILSDLSMRDSVTGDNNQPAKVIPLKGTLVRSYDDILAALGPGTSLNLLARQSRSQLFDSIRKLNVSQSRNLASISGGEALSKLVSCASIENANLQASATPDLSPVGQGAPAQLGQIWNINANTQRNNQNFVIASMVYNGLTGNAGHVALSLGGYDYHNGTRTTGETMDRNAGNIIARILATAALLKKRVFVYVNTDGSVTGPISDSDNVIWTSDAGNRGCMLGFAYDPLARPAMLRNQIGGFSTGQGVDSSSSPTAGNAEVAAVAMFANILAFNKQLPLLERIAPRVLTMDQLQRSALAIRG